MSARIYRIGLRRYMHLLIVNGREYTLPLTFALPFVKVIGASGLCPRSN